MVNDGTKTMGKEEEGVAGNIVKQATHGVVFHPWFFVGSFHVFFHVYEKVGFPKRTRPGNHLKLLNPNYL